VPHISLVLREMWDTTNLDLRCLLSGKTDGERRGIPHLAKNERDVGHPRSSCWEGAQRRGPGADMCGAGGGAE
jgi:hypothetical protein